MSRLPLVLLVPGARADSHEDAITRLGVERLLRSAMGPFSSTRIPGPDAASPLGGPRVDLAVFSGESGWMGDGPASLPERLLSEGCDLLHLGLWAPGTGSRATPGGLLERIPVSERLLLSRSRLVTAGDARTRLALGPALGRALPDAHPDRAPDSGETAPFLPAPALFAAPGDRLRQGRRVLVALGPGRGPGDVVVRRARAAASLVRAVASRWGCGVGSPDPANLDQVMDLVGTRPSAIALGDVPSTLDFYDGFDVAVCLSPIDAALCISLGIPAIHVALEDGGAEEPSPCLAMALARDGSPVVQAASSLDPTSRVVEWISGLDVPRASARVRTLREEARGRFGAALATALGALPRGSTPSGATSAIAGSPARLASASRAPDGSPRFIVQAPRNPLHDPEAIRICLEEAGYGGYDRAVRAFLDEQVAEDDLFIDLGSPLGVHPLSVAGRWPGRVPVLAVSWRPEDHERLCRSAREAGLSNLEAILVDHPRAIRIDALLEARPDLRARRAWIRVSAPGHEEALVAGAEGLMASGRLQGFIWRKDRRHREAPVESQARAMLATLAEQGLRTLRFGDENRGGFLHPFAWGPEEGHCLCLGAPVAPGHGRWAAPPGPAPVAESAFLSGGPDARSAWTRALMQVRGTDGRRWARPPESDAESVARARLAARHIPPGSRVLDLGAGAMALRHFLRGGTYTPADLHLNSPDTVLLDLSAPSWPAERYDCVTLLEVLEYVHEPARVLRELAQVADQLVLTCDVAPAGMAPDEEEGRRRRGFMNDLEADVLDDRLRGAGWRVVHAEQGGATALRVCLGEPPPDGLLDRVRLAPRAASVGEILPRGASLRVHGPGAELLSCHLPTECRFEASAPADIAVALDLPARATEARALLQEIATTRSSAVVCCRLSSLEAEARASDAPEAERRVEGGAMLARHVAAAGMHVQRGTRIGDDELLLQLEARPPRAAAARRVLLVAPSDPLHLGHRLRLRLLRGLMPPDVVLEVLDPCSPRIPESAPDLVILGDGGSFGPALLGPPRRRSGGVAEHLLALLERAPRAIGFFGTQYRQELDPIRVTEVLGRLALWLARCEADVVASRYRGANTVVLGDPLLAVTHTPPSPVPSCLHATRLSTLLATLPWLDHFSWRDGRNASGETSGRFAGVLEDVFGRSVPEGQWIAVDHAALARYRRRLQRALAQVRDTLRALLGS